MNVSLHQALWDHEKNSLGLGRTDFKGKPILCSPLEIFNRFACRFKEGIQSSLAPSDLNTEDLNPDLIRAYFKNLYETPALKTRDVSASVRLLEDFMEKTWPQFTKATPLKIQQTLKALDHSFAEFKRLRSLHRHLIEQWQSQIPLTPPTEPLGEDPNQLRLFSPENPTAEKSDYDLWVVVSKTRGRQTLSLQGQLNEKTHLLPVRRGVYERIQIGDRLPLSIALTWDEQPFIEEVEAPIYGEEQKA